MIYTEPARRTSGRSRIRWIRIAGLVVVIAAIVAALGGRDQTSSPSTSATGTQVLRGAPGEGEGAVLRGQHDGALGEADGAVPNGTTVFDEQVPGVARLDGALLGALRMAARDAGGNGVEFVVDSGWRSPEYQEQLLREAISKYGSEAEAARWVAPPDRSAHVKGDAVDLAPTAASWLSDHGAAYGLCRVYANEPWHYELRPEAIDQGCPAMYADPTHDPRIQP